MNKRLLAFGIVFWAMLLTLTGCGGGGQNRAASGSRARGRVALSIRWPETTTRLIPVASQSIRVALRRGLDVVGTQTVPRPVTGNESQIAFNDIETGDLSLDADAYPNVDASGVAQARGIVPVAVVAGQTAQVRLTMNSTIVRVDVTPSSPLLTVGQTVALTATPRDADNSVVLVSPQTLRWRSDDSALASVDVGSGVVTALAYGTARIVANESESGKEGVASLNVIALPSGPTPLWPRFHGGFDNAGYARANAVFPNQKWRVSAGSGTVSRSAAVGADGTVFATLSDGEVYALDGLTGGQKWRFDGGSESSTSTGSPALSPDSTLVYVVILDTTGENTSQLVALDAASGAVRWQQRDYEIESCPTVAPDGTVYAAGNGVPAEGIRTALRALDGTTGAVRWETTVDFDVLASPALGSRTGNPTSPDTVYFLSRAGFLHALDRTTGAVVWQKQVTSADDFTGSPAVGSDGTVYVAAPSGEVLAFAPADGAQKWRFQSDGTFQSSPAVGSDGTVYVGSTNSRLYALNGATGAQKWEFVTGDRILSSPAVITANGFTDDSKSRGRGEGGSADIVYVGSGDGYLYAVDARNGSVLWRYDTDDTIFASPAVGINGLIYIGTQGGDLYAIGASNGSGPPLPEPATVALIVAGSAFALVFHARKRRR